MADVMRTGSRRSTLPVRVVDFELANAAKRVVHGALSVVPGERLVVVADEPRYEVGRAFVEAARALGASADVVAIERFGARPLRGLPSALSEALRNAQASILIVGLDDAEMGMRRELLELVRDVRLRHAHMIGLTRKALATGFSADPARVLDTTRAVRTRLRPRSVLRLRTAAGAELEVRLGPASVWSVHDGAIRAGRWENLPAGELTTSPEEVSGVYVADASLGGQIGAAAGLLTSKPVRVEIEGGICKRVACVDRALARQIEEFIGREHHLNRVGTITLGTNIGILGPTGEFVCDQNLPGLHIAFGSVIPELTGASYQTRSQLMMTCTQSDIDLDGAALMRKGRYLIP
jgi:aminopeptidase